MYILLSASDCLISSGWIIQNTSWIAYTNDNYQTPPAICNPTCYWLLRFGLNHRTAAPCWTNPPTYDEWWSPCGGAITKVSTECIGIIPHAKGVSIGNCWTRMKIQTNPARARRASAGLVWIFIRVQQFPMLTSLVCGIIIPIQFISSTMCVIHCII